MTRTDSRISAALEFMKMNFSRKLSLREIASDSGLTRFHFLRLFRRTVGLPPHAYLLDLRVRAARSLIREGMDLARVATHVGFFDQSHMANRFRLTFGISPGQYRAAARILGIG